jgi:hypothetical protein
MKIYLGCDVGKNGGLAFLDENNHLEIHTTPLVANEISIVDINKIIKSYIIKSDGHLVCGVEDVHSIHGASAASNFQFGRALGILEGVVSARNLQWVKIAQLLPLLHSQLALVLILMSALIGR